MSDFTGFAQRECPVCKKPIILMRKAVQLLPELPHMHDRCAEAFLEALEEKSNPQPLRKSDAWIIEAVTRRIEKAQAEDNEYLAQRHTEELMKRGLISKAMTEEECIERHIKETYSIPKGDKDYQYLYDHVKSEQIKKGRSIHELCK